MEDASIHWYISIKFRNLMTLKVLAASIQKQYLMTVLINIHFNVYIYLFVCLGFFVPLENFSHIWRRNNYRWRATDFDLYSAHMAIEQKYM